ncbi:MAG: type III-B CRISPR module RAMP protein Cmr1 [Candidatus Marinimicrobia bacterium]|nr:type III-B CRISPR module RAMP protein Cmr1 [Candidatus Neomarinimicrobiota bacterium]MDD5582566.1 type III-B CRISPR module RAMP protein Cmr1 [Candidatus Neomarinimicrobiota bacterium]
MEQYTIKIKLLTPIWTGDADRKNTTLRETGIIGSLRWWYEALIRGLGGTACDPTNTNCNGDNHCDACELFGCTGWARKFKLETSFNYTYTIPEVWIGTREKRNNRYLKRKVDGFMSDGSIVLTFIPLKDISKNEWILLNSTFKVIEDYGAIGAHISQGSGVIKIVEDNLPYQNEKCRQLYKSKNSLASLDKFFFYKFKLKFKEDISKLINNKSFWTHTQEDNQFKDNWDNWRKLWENYDFLPIAFHIRDSLRHLENDKNKRHDIFGELGKGSKVFVSHGYKIDTKTVEFRIWGYEIDSYLLSPIKNNLESNLKQKLFSDGEDLLKNCVLKEEKSGNKLLEELK